MAGPLLTRFVWTFKHSVDIPSLFDYSRPFIFPQIIWGFVRRRYWKNLKLRSIYRHELGKGVKSVKHAHFNVMPACDEDAERTIARAATRRPTLDHNTIHVAVKHLKLRSLLS